MSDPAAPNRVYQIGTTNSKSVSDTAQGKIVMMIELNDGQDTIAVIQGVFFNWYPPKKLKHGKTR